MDLVYLWCDDQDPIWLEKKQHYYQLERGKSATFANAAGRFKNHDEIRYSLRSVLKYAPFFENIYLVTDNQRPTWLGDHPKIQVIHHRDILPNNAVYPLFCSTAIESFVHRIEGLSDRYVYGNDDFFFSQPIFLHDFIDEEGRVIVHHQKKFVPVPTPDTDVYFWMLYNSAKLLQGKYGVFKDGHALSLKNKISLMLHRTLRCRLPSHQFSAINRSAMFEAEKIFPKAFEVSRSLRFRHNTKCDPMLLGTYISLNQGVARSIMTSDSLVVAPSNLDSILASGGLQNKIIKDQVRFLCLNTDHSESLEHWSEWIIDYMKAAYPDPAPWETDFS